MAEGGLKEAGGLDDCSGSQVEVFNHLKSQVKSWDGSMKKQHLENDGHEVQQLVVSKFFHFRGMTRPTWLVVFGLASKTSRYQGVSLDLWMHHEVIYLFGQRYHLGPEQQYCTSSQADESMHVTLKSTVMVPQWGIPTCCSPATFFLSKWRTACERKRKWQRPEKLDMHLLFCCSFL